MNEQEKDIQRIDLLLDDITAIATFQRQRIKARKENNVKLTLRMALGIVSKNIEEINKLNEKYEEFPNEYKTNVRGG